MFGFGTAFSSRVRPHEETLLDYRRLPLAARREELRRTRETVEALLREPREAFPYVAVFLDGEEVPEHRLHDALGFVALARQDAKRKGEPFHPLPVLLRSVRQVIGRRTESVAGGVEDAFPTIDHRTRQASLEGLPRDGLVAPLLLGDEG
ncbi:MAG: hypothetical protein E7K72_16885 [Roseomonas mucosa]|nr:hypothetical protein [Roseomonas mucosa]